MPDTLYRFMWGVDERSAWAAEPGLSDKGSERVPASRADTVVCHCREVRDNRQLCLQMTPPSLPPPFLPVCLPVCLDIRDPEPPSRGLCSGARSAVPSLRFPGRCVLEFRFVSTWREGWYLCRRLTPQQAGQCRMARRGVAAMGPRASTL